jgi:hypothetical protein
MTRVKVDTRRVLRDTCPDNTSSQLGVLLWTTYALRVTGQHRQIQLYVVSMLAKFSTTCTSTKFTAVLNFVSSARCTAMQWSTARLRWRRAARRRGDAGAGDARALNLVCADV